MTKMYFCIIFLMFMLEQVCNRYFKTSKYQLHAAEKTIAEVTVDKLSDPPCYFDGYIAWKDDILLTGRLKFMGNSHNPIDVYWQNENGKTNLVCRIDFEKLPCPFGACKWSPADDQHLHDFEVKLLAHYDLNNSVFIMAPMMKEGIWQVISEVIRIRSNPIPVVKMDDHHLDPDNCFVDAPVGTNASLEFCVDYLSQPKLSVSVMRNPGAYQNNKCVRQDISLTHDELEVHMTYMGGCRQVGSVTCYFNGLNQTSFETYISGGSWMRILGIITSVCIVIGLIYYGYIYLAPSLKLLKEKKKTSVISNPGVVSVSHTDVHAVKSKSKSKLSHHAGHTGDDESSSSSEEEDAHFCGKLKHRVCSHQ